MGIQMNAPATAAGGKLGSWKPTDKKQDDLRRNERLVYEELCQAKSPKKAYDLLNNLHDKGVRAPMTIYRALESLIAKGHVSKIESLNAFVAINPEHHEQVTAFLICKECLQAKEIQLSEEKIADLFSLLQISSDDIRIEAFGDCEQVCER